MRLPWGCLAHLLRTVTLAAILFCLFADNDMPSLLHLLPAAAAERTPNATAIVHKNQQWDFQTVAQMVLQQAQALQHLQLQKQQRAAVYLPKQIETVSSFLAIA